MTNLPIIFATGTELLKLFAQAYFAQSQVLGLSQEESDKIFNEQKTEFYAKRPDTMEDV